MNAKDAAIIALAVLALKKDYEVKTKEKRLYWCERELKRKECVYTPYYRCKR